jgi:Ca2+/Na+ antiporter
MSIKGLVSKETLAFTLLVILSPIILLADGRVTMVEGGFAILAYLALAYSIRSKPEGNVSNVCIPENIGTSREFYVDIFKILVGAAAVFIASHFLVQESIAVALYLSIPASLLGLLLLSIGTNIPEIVIAIRAILAKRKDIAFGDYLGSAAANVPIFGALAIFTGGFVVESSEFTATALLALVGFALFYFFARSHSKLTRKEGTVLLLLYGIFVLTQFVNVIRFTVT